MIDYNFVDRVHNNIPYIRKIVYSTNNGAKETNWGSGRQKSMSTYVRKIRNPIQNLRQREITGRSKNN